MINNVAAFVTALIGCLLLIQLLWFVYKKYRVGDTKLLPGDWPLIGHILLMRDQKAWEEMKMKYYQENDGIVGLMYFNVPVFMVRKYEVWYDLFSSQQYLEKGFGYWVFRKLLGDGLLTSEGELWKKRRKMITPAFHFNILYDFISVMERKTLDLIEYVQKQSNGGALSLDIFKITKPYTMTIILETSMGVDNSIEETNAGTFKRLYEKTVWLLYARLTNPLHRSDWIYSCSKNGKDFKQVIQDLNAIIKQVIETRIQARNEAKESAITAPKRRIFIDVMLDAYEKSEIDVEGILDEVNTFVNAGYETTSTALAWTLYCLGRNQRVQEKLYREMMKVDAKSSKEMQDFKEMPYLGLVIKETMRLHPAILRGSRSVPNGTVLGGITFPACSIVYDMKCMNHNPDVWENPMEFIPERFENFEENKRSAFTYIPFSAGPRNCIGQRFAMLELKIALYHLVRTFRVMSSQKESDLEETFDFFHGSNNGLMVEFMERFK